MRSRTKPAKRLPGRPRLFDADAALENAMQLFWVRGFAATSLDDLANAMDMNRPSMANAFGDKEQIYRRALARFVEKLDERVGARLLEEPDLEKALQRFFADLLDIYFSDRPAPGCLVFSTAASESLTRPSIQQDARRVIQKLDDLLAERFLRAQRAGVFSAAADCRVTAQMTQAVLHSLSLRARAGASRASLAKLARHAVRVLAGVSPSAES